MKSLALLKLRSLALPSVFVLTSTCARSDSAPAVNAANTTTTAQVDLTGAGATFPYPLYSRWFNDYAQRTNVRINYQSIGSGGGIRQVIAGTVDFGATDVPMTDAELAEAKGGIEHLPTALGAVAITYNLPEIKRPLRLSGSVIADIFLGRIKRWDDQALKALNPDLQLPAREILLVHRADGSGTSYILSDYLASVSESWAAGPGRGKDVRWPAGVGGRGNEGVAGQIKAMEGAFGYVEVVYARQNFLPVAHIQNKAGKFAPPQAHEISAAAASVTDSLASSSDFRVSLVNASGDEAYPITSFTWMLINPKGIGPVKTQQLVQFLKWALREGEPAAADLGYVPLPAAAVARVSARLDALTR
ncbi:MAG: phosphate ABC transporter substrate-binding protein PstS [Phycisphaerae bacterium]|nr:phosphate ABC transporter substrate-binding protein PstS [Gemmatimonadaceae bacterium]